MQEYIFSVEFGTICFPNFSGKKIKSEVEMFAASQFALASLCFHSFIFYLFCGFVQKTIQI